jgi:serine/threonine protein kinase
MNLGNSVTIDKREYTINKRFGSGSFFVYSLNVDEKESNYLLKDIPLKNYQQYYETESKYLKIASELGVAPKFIHNEIINKNGEQIGIIIVEKYGEGSLTQLYNEGILDDVRYALSIKKQIKTILDTLYANGIDHNDLHSDNFLYHYENGEYNIKIIDFDKSRPLNNRKRKYIIEIIDTNLILDVSTIPTNNGGSKLRRTRTAYKRKNRHLRSKTRTR